jgi:hypothetical protein
VWLFVKKDSDRLKRSLSLEVFIIKGKEESGKNYDGRLFHQLNLVFFESASF